MKKNKISKNWINRQKRDIYVRQSKIEGFISRAVYKLKEIDENFKIFKDLSSSFKLSFLNKCDDVEKSIIAEYFQRCFDLEIENT